MFESSTSGPRIWISTSSARFRSGDCDCPTACPEPVTWAEHRAQVRTLLQEVTGGGIQKVSLNRDTFLSRVGEYTVSFNAAREPVVVLDNQAGQLLSFLNVPRTPEELKARFAGWTDGVLEQTVALLIAMGILAPSGESGEKQADVAREGPKILTAWFHLTHQCNLACKYCYVARSDQRMPPYIAEKAVDAVYRSALAYGYEQVRLKYAGGEPMLNFEALLAAQRRAESLSAETGIELRTVVLTNGTLLTDDQLDTLLAHDVQVMVSLDGIGPYQDAQRPPVGRAGGSFKPVRDTLDRLLDRGISPHISVTITAQNLKGLSELVGFLLDRQLRFSLNFYREPDGSSAHRALAFTSGQIIEGLREVFRLIERRLPRYSLLPNLTDRADPSVPHLRPCGVGLNYMVIDCNGDVSKCQMDMAYPITTIDADNPLEAIRKDTARVQNLLVDQKECRECVWRYRCAGGCPRLTFQHTGRYDARSPLCEVYRAILPEAVRLEALRMIRYEEPWDFGLTRD